MLVVAAGFVFVGLSFLNQAIAADFGVGISQVMLYYSIMSLTGAVSMTFLAPRLASAIGTRWFIVLAGAWSTLFLTLLSFMPLSLPILYALGFGLGLTFTAGTSMQSSVLVNSWFEVRRGSILGIVMSVGGLGGMLVGILMPWVMDTAGWRWGFRVLAAMFAVCTVLPGLFLIRSTPASVGLRAMGATDQPAGDLGDVEVPGVPASIAFRTPQFAAVFGSLLLLALLQGVLQHMAPLMQSRGVTLMVAGTLISLQSAVMIFASIGLGLFNDRFGTLSTMWGAVACLVASMGIWALGSGFLPLAVGQAFFAVVVAMPGLMTSIFVMTVFGPRDFIRIIGPVMASMPTGMAIGAPLWGWVYDFSGSYVPGLLAAAVMAIVIGLMLTWAIKSGHQLRSRVERELGQGYRIGTGS